MNLRTMRTTLMLLNLLIVSCIENVICGDNDYFSSISGLENLLRTEHIALRELQQYVDTVTSHVEALQSEIATITREHRTAARDVEGYLNNPVNAYRLIKRLHNDWTTFEDSVRDEVGRTAFLDAMAGHRHNLSFPTQDDVDGSAVALVRLQETYQLDVAQVASGVLNGVKYGSSMSWQDCFVLGQHLYSLRDFNHTIPWLKQSMKMLVGEEYRDDPLSLDFIEAVAAYHQEMGDFETALGLINHILAADAGRENVHESKAYIEQMITDGIKQGLMHETAPSPGDYRQSNEFKLYTKVCRAEVALTPTQQRPLRCKLHANNVAYRRLQPFKLEEHHLDPYVVQFHDVIRDEEINAVKRLAKPQMERSQVRAVGGSDATTSAYRTSKSAWFLYDEHHSMAAMRSHMGDFSGLNMEHAEHLQVANYGIGGHYEPHWDFFTDDDSYDAVDGNRVSTGIYYLSDVEEGGGTAFPFLHVLVKPQKGSVLFWDNLHSSEDRDYRTKHAACPVLKGSKWIANIWVRIRHQERERPCGLQREHEISLPYKDHD